MKLSEKTKLTRSGKLVPLISKLDIEDKGFSREQLRDLSVKLVLDNPGLSIGSLEEIENELISNHLVGYDTHSGLWFVCVRMPVSPYPEDFKSPERLTLEERLARHSFEEQAWNRKLMKEYSTKNGFQNWQELSRRDFEKWKLENGFVFSPGIEEKKPRKKNSKCNDDTYSV